MNQQPTKEEQSYLFDAPPVSETARPVLFGKPKVKHAEHYRIEVGSEVPNARKRHGKDGTEWTKHYADSHRISNGGNLLSSQVIDVWKSGAGEIIIQNSHVNTALVDMSDKQLSRWRNQAGAETRVSRNHAPHGANRYNNLTAIEAVGWGKRNGGPSNPNTGAIVRAMIQQPNVKNNVLRRFKDGATLEQVANEIEQVTD